MRWSRWECQCHVQVSAWLTWPGQRARQRGRQAGGTCRYHYTIVSTPHMARHQAVGRAASVRQNVIITVSTWSWPLFICTPRITRLTALQASPHHVILTNWQFEKRRKGFSFLYLNHDKWERCVSWKAPLELLCTGSQPSTVSYVQLASPESFTQISFHINWHTFVIIAHLPASIEAPAARISLNHILDNGPLEGAGHCRIHKRKVRHRLWVPLNLDPLRWLVIETCEAVR